MTLELLIVKWRSHARVLDEMAVLRAANDARIMASGERRVAASFRQCAAELEEQLKKTP